MTAAGDSPGRPFLVELVGPAGAGKSTVFENLLGDNEAIEGRPTLRKAEYTRVVATEIAAAVATLVRQRALSRRVRPEQVRMMMYLQALPQILARRGSDDGKVIVFDQGPLYFLTRWSLTDSRLAPWRERMLDAWAPLLDVVAFLDAPDALLRERINTRSKWHALKGAEGVSTLDALRASRSVYEEALGEFAARPSGPSVLRFDTSRFSAAEIAHAIVSAVNDANGGASGGAEPGGEQTVRRATR